MPRMQAFNKVQQTHVGNFLALTCAIYKAQFTKNLPKYCVSMEVAGGVHQLIATALDLGAKA